MTTATRFQTFNPGTQLPPIDNCAGSVSADLYQQVTFPPIREGSTVRHRKVEYLIYATIDGTPGGDCWTPVGSFDCVEDAMEFVAKAHNVVQFPRWTMELDNVFGREAHREA